MAKWYVTTKKADFQKIAEQYAISPITARLLRNREVNTEQEIEQFLHGTPEQLHDPCQMTDMKLAAETILKSIQEGRRIRIVGDYDIDGVCASYILLTGLRKCGADADVKLPDRIRDGYGINASMIEQASKDHIGLIVTCDNGIAAYEQLKEAEQKGIHVVVTDHHEVPYEVTEEGQKNYQLPPVHAVVDPHREDCTYPYSGICGAVVAYKLVQVLFKEKGMKESPADGFLEFAAIATVGDVMELLDENRILVKYGLEQMKHTENIGLSALIDATQIDRDKLSPFHIGFVLGPCINATGRLDSADRALALFMTRDRAEAAGIAAELRALNDSRKDMTARYQELALEQAEKMTDKVLVIYLPDCHESLAGIIAGRVRECYCKPVFVLTKTENGVKGSGRSIEAYHMYDEMTACSDLFHKYGGHKMAAGLSMEEKDIDELRTRLNAQTTLTEEDMQERVQIDIPMPFSYVTKELIKEFALLEPFGNGNPRPLFAEKNVRIGSYRVMGKSHNVVKLRIFNETGDSIEAVWFGDGAAKIQEIEAHGGENTLLSIAYTPELNVYMGQETIQLRILHFDFYD